MRVTSKGQITIPQKIRDQIGILPGSEVEFYIEDDVVKLRLIQSSNPRGEQIVNRLRGKGTVNMTTDEILALTRDSK